MNLSHQYMLHTCKDLAAYTTGVPEDVSVAIVENPENLRCFSQYLTGVNNTVMQIIEEKLQPVSEFATDVSDKYECSRKREPLYNNAYRRVGVNESERLLPTDDKNDRLEEAKSSLVHGLWHRINYINYAANKKGLTLKDVIFVQRLSRAAKKEIEAVTRRLAPDSDEKKIMDNVRSAFKGIQHNHRMSSLAKVNIAR